MNASCHHCGQKYEVEDEMLGKKVECQSCGENFIISTPEAPLCPPLRVSQVSEGVLHVVGSYAEVFDALKQTMEQKGGTLKVCDMQEGKLEGAWEYGLIPFGLHVTARFNTLSTGAAIEITIKGGLKGALDTKGEGRKMAREVASSYIALFPEQEQATSQLAPSMPPPKPGGNQSQVIVGAGDTPQQRKQKVLAGILALLIGGVGGHKFYLGSWGWGLVYLLLCWTYVPSIVALVEGIILLCMKEENFDIRYNKTSATPFKW